MKNSNGKLNSGNLKMLDKQQLQFTRLPMIEKSERENWKRQKEVMAALKLPSGNVFFQYGFEVIGPLLFGFCKWLHEITASQNSERLFFLSRDGYLLLHAYTALYPSAELPVSYLYISRKAAREAQLWIKPDLGEVSKLFPKHVYLQREEFCKYFNVEDSEAERIWADCSLPLNMHFLPKDLLNDQRLTDFYERMKPRIIEESRKSYLKMIQYLRQEQLLGQRLSQLSVV